MNLSPEQLKQNAAAMIAFADGKPIEYQCRAHSWQWCQTFTLAHIHEFPHRPAPDPIATGHNPDKLLVSQVGEGWRLLDKDEIKHRSGDIQRKDVIECWEERETPRAHFGRCRYEGNYPTNTYRTRLTREELAALDKPAKCEHPKITIGGDTQCHCEDCGKQLFKHEDAPYWREEKPAWKMPAPPAGQQWYHTDFTEADLPEGWRPLLMGERPKVGDMCREASCHSWEPVVGLSDHVAGDDYIKTWYVRTRRPLPSAPKIVPWDCADDLPSAPILFVFGKKCKCPQLVTFADDHGVWVTGGSFYAWCNLDRYSTDRKTWLPCTKTIPPVNG